MGSGRRLLHSYRKFTEFLVVASPTQYFLRGLYLRIDRVPKTGTSPERSKKSLQARGEAGGPIFLGSSSNYRDKLLPIEQNYQLSLCRVDGCWSPTASPVPARTHANLANRAIKSGFTSRATDRPDTDKPKPPQSECRASLVKDRPVSAGGGSQAGSVRDGNRLGRWAVWSARARA